MYPDYITVYDHKGKQHELYLSLEIKTDQIEVWCAYKEDFFIVWRNNRPLLNSNNSKAKLKWDLIKPDRVTDARLLANVLDELKKIIKDEETGGFEARMEYIRTKKSY